MIGIAVSDEEIIDAVKANRNIKLDILLL